eukprot:TRINITY_DN4965_c2_g3_i1.p1 TRINITY_DN4965_c2_g3~~TRINITY_DN4965_c2_g3_i1.p1  ORF type:complete len:125 (+),score=1.65 TRINITY_DN4965_c2_g3_i1:49-375(+)
MYLEYLKITLKGAIILQINCSRQKICQMSIFFLCLLHKLSHLLKKDIFFVLMRQGLGWMLRLFRMHLFFFLLQIISKGTILLIEIIVYFWILQIFVSALRNFMGRHQV